MEPGYVDPHYDSHLALKTELSSYDLLLDCGAVLRAIDTLLMIAPREFRTPKEWMIRLYETRRDIVKAIEAEVSGEDVVNDEEVQLSPFINVGDSSRPGSDESDFESYSEDADFTGGDGR